MHRFLKHPGWQVPKNQLLRVDHLLDIDKVEHYILQQKDNTRSYLSGQVRLKTRSPVSLHLDTVRG